MTPEPIVARLNSELAKIAAAASVNGKLAAESVETVHTSAQQARAHLKSEIVIWGKVVKTLGLKPE